MMATALLRRFATDGLTSVNASDFHLVAQECLGWWRLSEDVRYYFISQWFAAVSSWWSKHDESGGVPIHVAHEVEAFLRSSVSRVLSDGIPGDQAMDVASHISEELKTKLTDTGDWRCRGLIHPVP